jgi:hypothetical protein
MRMYRFVFPVAVFALALALGLPNVARAQSGTISGTVSDSTGAVIQLAQVTARDTNTGATRSTTTNSQGFYEFLAAKPSTYEVTVEAKGFVRAVKHDISVVVGLESHFDVRLTPGSVSETVEVKAEVPLLEPDKTNVSYSIQQAQIQNLPLQGRQFLDLALLTPGVTAQAPGTQAGGINVAGNRSQSNNFTLSGISINDPQVNGPLNGFHIADAVQEFNVNTSIASTDLGRASGAQVTIITKSGTNTYHGSGFYYGRNEALDANDWFLNSAGKPKNELRRHQYGGTVGGYVFKDKTFWFLSFEGFNEKNPLPQLVTVPTAAARALVTDPVSLKLLQFIPAPNIANPTSGSNWAGTADQSTNNDTFLIRVDHTLSQNNHLMAQYLNVFGNSLQLQTGPFNGAITNLPGSQTAVVEETFSHTTWLNVFRVGYTRNVTDFAPQDVKLNPASIFTDASGNPLPGFVDATRTPLNGGLPRITISSSAAVPLSVPNNAFGVGAGTNMPQGRTTDTYQIIDNVTKTLGVHTLQFGGEVRREETFRFLNGNFRGAIAFVDWAHFAAGIPLNGSLRTGGPDQTFRSWNRFVEYTYVQDSWKLRPNFTLNYGLRYELPGALSEKRDSGSNLVPGFGLVKLNSDLVVNVNPTVVGRSAITLVPTNGAFLPSTGQFQNATKNFAPFVGMAWSPRILHQVFGDNQTVIRTGFRISYDDVFANIPVNQGLNFPPVLSTTLPNSNYTWATALNQNRLLFAPDSTLTTGPTCGASPTRCRGILGFNAWDTSGRSAYAMSYTLEIERQIGADYAVNAAYVGNLGRKLGVFVDANEPFVTVNNPAQPGTALPNTRAFPYPQYQGIPIGTFAGSSNYNGMVLTIRKRPTHGFSFQGSYTYAKSLDYGSSFFGSTGETGAFADPRNPQADYGPSAFDIRHQFVFNYLYELPFGKGRLFMRNANPVVEQLLGGWDVGGITNVHSGFPFTIFANTLRDFSGFNQFADRPNAGNTPLTIDYSKPARVFPNTPCGGAVQTGCFFNIPSAGSVGNLGRNAFTGPGYTDFDFSLQKNFPIAEGKKFQLRADVFNIFNHPNFALPNGNLQLVRDPATSVVTSSRTAGTITSVNGNPRLMQLGLRFDW